MDPPPRCEERAAGTARGKDRRGRLGYDVYRGTTPGGEGATPYVTVTSPTYTDRSVVAGRTYYYQFTAFSGGVESARTQEFPAHAN